MKYTILFLLFFVSYFAVAQDTKTYIPEKAKLYLPMVASEVDRTFPSIPIKHYTAGLIEQESCISLKHSKCWSPTSQLKTKREEGAGLGQLTRAYNEDGSVRFDSLTDMVKRNKAELKELAWSNVYSRPDLQIRTMLIMTRDNYKALYKVEDPVQRLKMTDLAYNAGGGRIAKNRMACGLAKDCNPQIWDNNVERYCTASKKPIYGNRSACDIMNEHVNTIFDIRLAKYKPYF